MDLATTIIATLGAGLAQCGPVIADNRSLIGALFVAGLVGGTTHCIAMCGPFVVAQVGARLGQVPIAEMGPITRLVGGALWPYHLGRLSTYVGLGGVAAALRGQLDTNQDIRWLSATCLAIAAVVFFGFAIKHTQLWQRIGIARQTPPRGNGIPAHEARNWSRLATFGACLTRPLFEDPRGWRGYGLGVALGFIPCGLLYGALVAAASATGGALAGGFAMGAFAIGTAPGLLVVGLMGQFAASRWQSLTRRVALYLMPINGCVLLWLAASQIWHGGPISP